LNRIFLTPRSVSLCVSKIDQSDQFDSLTDVSQTDPSTYETSVAQARTFRYTSLNRLKSAANPESGTINYTYRNGGALLTRTDARNAMVTHSYQTAGLG